MCLQNLFSSLKYGKYALNPPLNPPQEPVYFTRPYRDGLIPYEFENTYPVDMQRKILETIQELEQRVHNMIIPLSRALVGRNAI